MKIGIITNLYPPYARGGAEYVVVRTVEALTELNHEVFIITGGPRKQQNKEIDEDRTPSERIYRFFPRNLYFILNDFKQPWFVRLCWHIIDAFSFYGRRKVASILDEEKPDVVITHNLKGIGLSIPHAVQKRKIPHVHIVHDLQLIYPSGLLFAGKEKIAFFLKPIYAIYQKICRCKLGTPDLVISPSNYLKDEYLKHRFFKKTKVEVMPNPAPKFVAEERHGRSPGPLRLLFVGQLEEHKGIKFLIEQFKKLDIDAKLIIAGEGTYLPKLKKIAGKDKRIIYLGFISVDQLVSCFGVADALIVPSLCYENSPTVIYESLNAGVPVVASDIGGVGELVEDGKNGFLFKAGSETDFQRAIGRLDEMKDEFAKKQKEIQETVAPYKIKKYTAALLDRLERLMQ